MNQALDSLREQVLACEKCRLAQTRHQVVFGVGCPGAQVLFIGEGPGENEDLQGEPFVGRGGQLLDKFLAHVDLSRQKNIFITNMVKCRPPQNRDPQPDEMDACLPWLRLQTTALAPKIIVCLGRVAAQRLISPDFKVTKDHGAFVEKNGVWITGTFHPAALLRTPTRKEDALRDFLALRQKILEVCPQVYDL